MIGQVGIGKFKSLSIALMIETASLHMDDHEGKYMAKLYRFVFWLVTLLLFSFNPRSQPT